MAGRWKKEGRSIVELKARIHFYDFEKVVFPHAIFYFEGLSGITCHRLTHMHRTSHRHINAYILSSDILSWFGLSVVGQVEKMSGGEEGSGHEFTSHEMNSVTIDL